MSIPSDTFTLNLIMSLESMTDSCTVDAPTHCNDNGL